MLHPLTSRLIMIAGLFAALVLAGCGGGGDSGVENTLRVDLEALQEKVSRTFKSESGQRPNEAELTPLRGLKQHKRCKT